jgi:hypothetical protein
MMSELYFVIKHECNLVEVCIKIICIISQEVIVDKTKLAINHWIGSVGSEFVQQIPDRVGSGQGLQLWPNCYIYSLNEEELSRSLSHNENPKLKPC